MRVVTIIYLAFFSSLLANAQMADVVAEQAKSRQSYIQRFSDFVQNKDVMGRSKDPMGNPIQEKQKFSFNPDDQITFQSDLTYHDYQYEEPDKAYNDKYGAPNNPNPKFRDLPEDVSPHGAIAKGNGSSLLERVVYELFDRFYNEEQKKQNKIDENKTGFRYDNAFKIEVEKVTKRPPTGSGPPIVDKIERRKFRDEAIEKIRDVGDQSFQETQRLARDNGKGDDKTNMGTIAFYYEEANRGLKAMYNSILADLGQRRAYNGVDTGGESIKLNEETPDCGSWAQEAIAQIPQNTPPAARADMIKSIQGQAQQCQTMVGTSYKMINPRMVADRNGKAQLKSQGVENEDAMERDGRVNLEMLSKVGTNANDVPSNWKYKPEDEKALVTVDYDKQGNATSDQALSMYGQVDRYNQQLVNSTEKLDAIKSRLPGETIDANKILSYQIAPNTKSAAQITQFPQEALDPDFEVQLTNRPKPPPQPDSYEKLMNQQTE